MSVMTKKRALIFAFSIILTLTAFVGTTVAFLVARAGPLENVFTIGEVEISLTETTGGDYSMIPGTAINKDPKITVKGGSEASWLFVTVSKSQGFDDYLSFTLDDSWTLLPGYSGVYYQSVPKSNGDREIYVLKNNEVLVSSTLTEEKMSGIEVTPTLTFKAYAIQSYGIEAAADGWKQLLEEGAER